MFTKRPNYQTHIPVYLIQQFEDVTLRLLLYEVQGGGRVRIVFHMLLLL